MAGRVGGSDTGTPQLSHESFRVSRIRYARQVLGPGVFERCFMASGTRVTNAVGPNMLRVGTAGVGMFARSNMLRIIVGAPSPRDPSFPGRASGADRSPRAFRSSL